MKGVRQVECLGSKFNSLSFAQLEASGKGYIELPHTWTCNAVGTHISKSAGGWLREGRGIQVAIQVPALWIEISGISIPGISRICRHGVRDAMRPGVVARHGNAANGTALNRKDQTLITRRGTAVDAIESFAISSSIVSRYPRAMASKAHQLKRTAKESDYRALAEFRYHIGRYLDFSDQAAKAAGIEPRQYQLLLALRGLPKTVEPTVGALAQQLRSHHHSTVELINRAEANDFVQRSRVGTRVLVRLTKKGGRVLARAVEKRLEELRVAGPVLVKALQQLINHNSKGETEMRVGAFPSS